MCGIIGYIGNRNAAPILMSGLKRLEYRGYDSAGIALVSGDTVRVHKAAGKLAQLEAVLPKRLGGKLGIGHTRWATHGAPSDANAHPHLSADGSIAVVHNGIVENASALRARLVAEGVDFASETDTEIIAHLIARTDGPLLEQRVRDALALVRGTYGIAVIDSLPAGPHRHRAQGLAGHHRHRRSRDVRRVRRRRARAPHPSGRASRRRRGGSDRCPGLSDDDHGCPANRQVPGHRRVGRRRLRTRRTCALHVQGDSRSAGGDRAHAGGTARSSIPHRASRRAQPRTDRAARREAGQAPRLRLRLLRRASPAPTSSNPSRAFRPRPSPRRSSAIAIPSSSATRSTLRSASRARPSTR